MARVGPRQNRGVKGAKRRTLALDTQPAVEVQASSVEQATARGADDKKPDPGPGPSRDRLRRHLRQLERHRVELLRELAGSSLEFHDLCGSVPEGDQPEYRTAQSVSLGKMRHLTEALRTVEAAISRAAAGAYGLCSDCGKRIPAARLRANPAATRCVACQERAEKRR